MKDLSIYTKVGQRLWQLLVVFIVGLATNGATFAQGVETPVISPAAGTYSGQVTVSMTCATSGAVIRYTADGSEPIVSSQAYQNPFTLYYDATIKAKAFGSGTAASTTGTAAYVVAPFTSGMRLWLRADSMTSGSDQQLIDLWPDCSGRAQNATATSNARPVLSSTGANGKPAVVFDGTNQYLSLPHVMESATAGEIFTVLKAAQDNPGVDRGLWSWNDAHYGARYPAASGKILEGFGNIDGFDMGDPSQALDQWNLYSVTVKPNECTARINGGSLNTIMATMGFPQATATYFPTYLGQSYGCWPSTTYCKFAGSIAEVIAYDHVLTFEERKAIEMYFGQKYQLETFLSAPTLSTQSGIKMWLKADSGVTVSGSSVTKWADQSANQFALSEPTDSRRPQLIPNALNGKPVLRFDGVDDILYTESPINICQGSSDWTIFVVTQPKPAQNIYADILDHNHDSASFAIEQNGTETNQYGFAGGGLVRLNSNQVQMLSWVKMGPSRSVYVNGIQSGYPENLSFSPVVKNFAVGGWYYGLSRNYGGDIAEIIIYKRGISDIERREVERYLALKYGLVSVPVLQPTNLQAEGISPSQVYLTWSYESGKSLTQFSVERKAGSQPYQQIALISQETSFLDSTAMAGTQYSYRLNTINYSGSSAYSNESCVRTPNIGSSVPFADAKLWLKEDSVFVNDGFVEKWIDGSVNRFLLSAPSAARRPKLISNALNGRSVLRFDGVDDFLWTGAAVDIFQGSSDFTVFLVTQPKATQQTSADILDQDHRHQLGFVIEQDGANANHFGVFSSQTVTLDSNRMQVLSSVKEGSSEYNYINGVQMPHVTDALFNPTVCQFAVGGWVYGKGRNYGGDIAEIIIFNRTLSDAERVATETYLLDKYRQYNDTACSPVFSPAQGCYGSPALISLSSSINDAQIYYTLDGSTPTQASTLFNPNTPITLRQSATIKAIAFKEGMNPSTIASATYLVGSAPVLYPIPDQVVAPGGTLQISLRGADPDVPAQTLSYSSPDMNLLPGGTATLTGSEFVWECPATAIGGTNTVVFVVSDSGTPSLSGTTRVNIRVNEGPSLTNPMYGGAPLTGSVTLSQVGTMQITATDSDGIAKVEFYDGSSLIGTASGGSGDVFSLPWDITKVAAGSHTLSVKAWDRLGVVRELNSITVTVQPAAPAAPVFDAGQDGIYTNKAQFTLKGSAEKGCGIQFYVGDSGSGQGVVGTAGPDGHFAPPVTLQSGTNVIRATASRLLFSSTSSQESEKSTPVQIVVDLNIPSAPSNLTAEALVGGEVNLTWRAPQTGAIASYRVYRSTQDFTGTDGLVPIKTVTSLGFRETPPTDETYYYRVSGVNTAGTESPLSNAASIQRDNVPPKALSITYTQNGAAVTSTALRDRVAEAVVEMSEKVIAAPFLTLAPSSGPLMNVELLPITSGTNRYKGTIVISSAQASGTATAILSARDIAGNIGTVVDSGKTVLLDTAGPRIVELSPLVTAVQTSSTAPAQLNFTVVFDEKPVAPVFHLIASSGTIPNCVGTATVDPLNELKWTVQFPPLPTNLGQTPEVVALSFTAKDGFDHEGGIIVPNHQFTVYQGQLPPLDPPTGLKAVSRPNGTIELSWQATANADSTKVYRKAAGDPDWTFVPTPAGTTYLDDPKTATGSNYQRNGIYNYAVTSVRKEIGPDGAPVTAESGYSSAASAVSDDQAPQPPLAPELQLQGGGLQITGTAVADAVTYRLYRKGSSTAAVQIGQDLVAPQCIDPAPDPAQPYYHLTALDAAGNESSPFNQVCNTHDLLPVQNLTVEQADNGLPVVTWQRPPGNVTGCSLNIGPGDGTKVTKDLLQPDASGEITYRDVDWSGETQHYTAYSVRELDGQQHESPHLTVTLPNAQFVGDPSNKLVRGLINALRFTVTNQSSERISHARLVVSISGTGALTTGTSHCSTEFDLEAGQTSGDIVVKVPGYEDLPQTSVSAYVTLKITPTASTTALISRAISIPVGEGGLTADIMASSLTKGGTGTARFKIGNPGTESVEIITALNNGKSDSSEVRLVLLDAMGNVLARVPFKQVTQNGELPGGSIIPTPQGVTLLRLNSGEVFTSSPVAVPVPSSAPEQIYIELQVDRIYAEYGAQPPAPVLNGITSKRSFSILTTPYEAKVTSAVADAFKQEAVIAGSATLRGAQAAPAANVPIALTVETHGFERTYSVITDAQGHFSYAFHPEQREAGGVYSVWARHPEISERTPQATFTLGRVFADYDQYNTQVIRNHATELPLNISNASGSIEESVRLEYLGVTETGGGQSMPSWLSFSSPLTLNGGATGILKAQFQPDSTVTTGIGSFYFRLVSTGSGNVAHTWQVVQIDYQIVDAAPVLSVPAFVNTGARKPIDETTTAKPTIETIDIANAGVVSVEGVKATLLNANGTEAPTWISILGSTDLGSIQPNAKQTVQLSINPDASVPETVAGIPGTIQQFKLHIESANAPERDVPIYVTVTSGANGTALLHVYDLFMGYSSDTLPVAQNASYTGLPDAKVSFENETTGERMDAYTTGSDGQVMTPDLPVGPYRLRVTANKHDTYQGRIWIKPGITVTQEINLNYQTVSIEWSVVPTTIIDRYKLSVQATYETNVPAPVVTIEPAVFEIPEMGAGDTYTGQFVVTNRGLIEATDFGFSAPANDEFFTYELLGGLPSKLLPNQQIVIPYKIRCVKALPGSGAKLSMSTASAPESLNLASGFRYHGIGSSSVGPMYQNDTFGLLELVPVGNDCFTYSTCFPYTYRWQPCPTNPTLVYTGYGSSCSYYRYGSCSGSASTSGTTRRSSGYNAWGSGHSVGGGTNVSPMAASSGDCVVKPKCKPSPNDCPTCECLEPVGSWVDLINGSYIDAVNDLVIRVPGGYLPVVRRFDRVWSWDLLERLQLTYDAGRITGIVKQGDKFSALVGSVVSSTTSLPTFTAGSEKIVVLADRLKWTDSKGNWMEYDVLGFPMSYGKNGITLAKFTPETVTPTGTQISLTGTSGAVTYATVDYAGNKIAKITARGGRSVTYTYKDSRLSTVLDASGSFTKFDYDDDGRITKKVTPKITRHIEYFEASLLDPFSGVEVITGSNGEIDKITTQKVRRIHDSDGNGVTFSQGVDSTAVGIFYSKVTYDAGLINEKWFDVDGNLVEQWTNGKRMFKKIKSGRIFITPGPNGGQTVTQLDTENNVISVTSPDGGVVTTEYDYRFTLPSRIVTNGVETRNEYDANGNLTTHTEAFGTLLQRITKYEYNDLGQLTKMTDPMGRVTMYEYDPDCGRLTREYDPAHPDSDKQYHYDDRGFMDWSKDAMGRETTYVFDGDERKISETDPAGFTTTYSYLNPDLTPGANLTQVESGIKAGCVSRITRYKYDGESRQTAILRVDDGGVERLQQKFDYDTAGRIYAETNALGQVTSYEYDERGNRTKIKRPYKPGQTSDTTYVYDDANRLIQETDPKDVVTKTDYDVMGRVACRTEALRLPEERSTSYLYDKNGNPTDITYTSGTSTYVTHYDYDALGRKIAISGDRELPKTFEYNADNTLAAQTDGEGNRTTFTYTPITTGLQITGSAGVNGQSGERSVIVTEKDWEGNTTCIIDGEGNRRYFHSNAINQLTDQSITIPAGSTLSNDWWTTASRLVHKDYNAWGQEVASVNALGATTSAHYDRFGRMDSSTDASGLTLSYDYDGLDRLLAKTYPAVPSAPSNTRTKETATYDSFNGLLATTTDRAGSLTQYLSYDVALRTGTTVNPLGKSTSYTYDNLGRVQSLTDPYNNTTSVEYDQFNNAVKITYPDHVTGATGTNARIAYIAYNNYGLRSDESGAGRYQIHYDYDLAGNLTAMTDGNNSVTHWDYDAQNRLAKKTYDKGTNPEGKWFGYTYYGTGQVYARTDGTGRVTQYTYNADARLTGITYPNDPAVSFDYDALGNRTSMVCASGTTTWTYYPDSTCKSETRTDTGSALAYTYDAEKHRTSMVVTTGSGPGSAVCTTTYRYNEAGQMAQLFDSAVSATVPFRYLWQPGTQLLQTVQTPSGARTEKAYDDAMRLQSITAYDADSNVVDSYVYEYDAVSQRTSETTPAWVRKFEYDQQRQLTASYRLAGGSPTAHDEGYDYSHQFDAIGNRLAATANGASTAYVPNSLNQYASITQAGQMAQPVYDANGNLTDDGSQTYTFDDENRLVNVQRAGVNSASVYDALCRRVAYKKQNGQNETRFVYDGWNVVAELDAANTVTRRYTWGLDLSNTPQGAGGVGGLLAMTKPTGGTNAGTYVYNYDGNGNITSMVKADDQTVAARYEYGPFGETVLATGAMAASNPFRFSTKYTDDETGLLYYGYRYYNPSTGRWINRDPLGERGGENLYHFVFNNPIRWIDYNGLWGDGNYGRSGGDPGSRGHSDFPGNDMFDYTKEDQGETSPFNPKSTWRHFRSLEDSEKDIVEAIKSCNKDGFERASHQMQDFFSHYGQGYRASEHMRYNYAPFLVGSGHGVQSFGRDYIARPAGFGVARPDNATDYQDAYAAAKERTQYWVDRMKKCCCSKSRGKSDSECSAKAPANPWGNKAPAPTPENGYWRNGWNATSGAAASAWNTAQGWF